jgi:Golgi SNAP receptor complex protein 2
MLTSGSNILENMRSQRSTLKSTHRRMMDIANTLGLSNTTMRLIEKRALEDKYILLGGMFVTCVIIVLLIVYVA